MKVGRIHVTIEKQMPEDLRRRILVRTQARAFLRGYSIFMASLYEDRSLTPENRDMALAAEIWALSKLHELS